MRQNRETPFNVYRKNTQDFEYFSDCTVCGSSLKDSQVYKVDGFSFVRCRLCDLACMNPRPSASLLSRFYSGDYWGLIPSGGFSEREQIRQLRRGVVFAELLQQQNVRLQGKRILEIGPGLGGVIWSLCQIFEATGYALEPDPRAQKILIKNEVECLTEENLRGADDSFDLVVMSHVLEHQTIPGPLLALAISKVCPGGTLLIEVPNGDYARDGGIQHPIVFSKLSLGTLLSEYEADVSWHAHNGLEDVLFFPSYLTAVVQPARPKKSSSLSEKLSRPLHPVFAEAKRSLGHWSRKSQLMRLLNFLLGFRRRRVRGNMLKKLVSDFSA